jgi:hypothetical protein
MPSTSAATLLTLIFRPDFAAKAASLWRNSFGSCLRALSQRSRIGVPAQDVLLSVHHLVQVRGCAFYIEMLVLSRPAFRGEHRATVNSFEVAIRELVSFLRVRVLFIVNPKCHLAYSRKPFMRMNSFSIAVEGWSSLHASLIAHNLPLRDEFQVIDTTVNG